MFPAWTIAPFILYLLIIALLPLVLGHFWERNRNKLLVAAVVSLPVLVFLLGSHATGAHLLVHAVREYTAFLAVGALLASLIGTTGASVLLIRPLLRANASRQRVRHVVVFFIFTVSNGAGLLTPLGDPPLFLGFLRGVPFAWTLQLWPAWALLNGTLLVLFNVLDQYVLNKEERERPGPQYEEVQRVKERFRIDGKLNLLWLAAVPMVIAVLGTYGPGWFSSSSTQGDVQVALLAGIALLSFLTTERRVHRDNHFSWAPIVEVAVVFLGIFVTMIPALAYLEVHGVALGLSKPWQFFWAAGALSSFLDNAPTYLTFTSLAVGVVNQVAGTQLVATDLAPLAAHPQGLQLLAAVSCGSVFMGAVTYIGNGPNFMVKAIAEQGRVRMPGFFGYMAWSCGILLPLFVVLTLIFF
jgi:Na+/H+ antiporter NhaD/arsenite permease-like protein